jgi:hypothetical protein
MENIISFVALILYGVVTLRLLINVYNGLNLGYDEEGKRLIVSSLMAAFILYSIITAGFIAGLDYLA